MISEPGINVKRNQMLLVLILLLDLVGFSLIFPLVPRLLAHYLAQAKTLEMDGWLTSGAEWVSALLPSHAQGQHIVLLGGILSAVYSLLQYLAAPVWGRWSDRVGRRPVLIVSSLGLALSYLLWVFSGSFTVFMASRILGGLMAGNLGVASAAMADMTTPADRTKAMGLLGAAFGIGFIIGPVIGGITARLDATAFFPGIAWLNPFSVCAFISLLLSGLSALLNYIYFQETLPAQRRSLREWVGNPFRPLGRVSIPGLSFALGIYGIYMFFFAGFEFTVTFFYTLAFGLSPTEIGFVFLYLGLLIAAGQGGLVRTMTGKVSEKTMAIIGTVAMPIPLLGLAYSPPALGLSLLCLAPIALGSALVQPAMSSLTSLITPPEEQGLVMGVFRSFGSLARAVGPLTGAFVYWSYGAEVTYKILAICFVASALLAFGLVEVRRHVER